MKKLLLILLLLLLKNTAWSDQKTKKLKAAANYQFILVHGVSSWDQEWYNDGVFKLLQEDMGIPAANVHAYSANFKEQSGFVNAREVGDRSYAGPRKEFRHSAINKDDTPDCDKSEKFSISWIDKAKLDYKNYYEATPIELDGKTYSKDFVEKRLPTANIPSEVFFITHSYGNAAVRGYLCSGGFPRGGKNDVYTSPLLPNQAVNIYTGTEITDPDYQNRFVNNIFYQDDVTKVVFLAPPFTGSDMAFLASIKAIFLFLMQNGKQMGAGVYAMPLIADLFSLHDDGKFGTLEYLQKFDKLIKLVTEFKKQTGIGTGNSLDIFNNTNDSIEILAPALRENQKEYLKFEAMLDACNMINESNQFRILPEQYSMMLKDYAFKRVVYSVAKDNSGWNNKAFSLFGSDFFSA